MSNFNRESDFDGDSDLVWANDFDGDSDFTSYSDFARHSNFEETRKWLSQQDHKRGKTISVAN